MSERYRLHESGPLAILDTRPDDPPESLALASAMLGGLFFSVIPEDWATGIEGDWWRRELRRQIAKLNWIEDQRIDFVEPVPHPFGAM